MNKELRQKAIDKLTEDEYSAISAHSYQLGQVVAWEEFPMLLHNNAAACFNNGKDGLAKYLRLLADDIHKKAKARRAEFMKEFID
jgi:hypothetical protein